MEQQKSQYHDELVAAESRLDRLRSVDPQVNGKTRQKEPIAEANSVKEEVIEEEKPLVSQNPAVSSQILRIYDVIY